MIKLLIVTALIAIVSGSAIIDSDDGVEGVLINREYRSSRAVRSLSLAADEPAPLVCPAGAKGNICATDCKTLLGCLVGNPEPLTQGLCDSLTPSSPYCIPGSTGCSSTGNTSIEACTKGTPSSFVCTNTGYFPDPLNCTKYHICTDDVADTYSCPPNYVYDGINSNCKSKRYTSDCVTVNCAASANKYVVYTGNKAYYAFCSVSAGISNPIMFRCEDTANFQFNVANANCEFVCKAEGWYPDYINCQNYYECYKSGTKLLSRIQTCPATYIFDVTKSTCIKGTCPTEAPPVVDA